MPLDLDSRQVGDVMVIRCRGRIVAGNECQSLQTQVKQVIPEVRAVILHLGEVQFVDSSGLGTLVRLHSTAKAGGGAVKLCALSPMARQLLQFTNLHKLFEVYESETEAVSAFYRSSSSTTGEPAQSSIQILCVDSSLDVLAYLRELLRGAGYRALTSTNLPDAQLLLKAARTNLVIVGPSFSTVHSGNIPALGKHANGIPLLVLDSEFSCREAGDAGRWLLESVRSRLGA
jgi:anti-sigma B factor antagonist